MTELAYFILGVVSGIVGTLLWAVLYADKTVK